jgi:hypothetical protein
VWTIIKMAQNSPVAKGGYNADVSKNRGHVSAVPLPLQKMLWTPNDGGDGSDSETVASSSPLLRQDRDVLWASLEGGGLDETLRIPWTELLAKDRPVLLKIFETCPWCLNEAAVPDWCLDDKEVLLTFVRSRKLTYYRCVARIGRDGVVKRFSPKLLQDTEVLSELVVQTNSWSKLMVGRSGIGEPSGKHPVLDNEEFVLRAAERLRSRGCYYDMISCPVRYERLSPRLKASRDVVLSFIPLDLDIVRWSKIPDWMKFDPDIVQARIQVDKDLAHLRGLVFPADDGTDRNRAVRQVLVRSASRWYDYDWAPVLRVQSRQFWIDVAETHKCPVAGYEYIPKRIASVPSVVMAWARHASCMDVQWLEWADDRANVLADREALLHCLPQVWKACNLDGDNVWGRIDPALLDEPTWTELLARTQAKDVDCVARLVWDQLRSDTFLLRALLRCGMKKVEVFNEMFRNLPPGVQLQCAAVLVEACRTRRGGHVYFWGLNPELLQLPEVVHAALSNGWRTDDPRDFASTAATAPWSRDARFLLSVAEKRPALDFWECCSADVRRDKDLMARAVRLNSGVWSCLDDDNLRYAFDVLCGMLLGSEALLNELPRLDAESRRDVERCRLPTRRIVEFARELRRRLVLYASLETLRAGICDGPSGTTSTASVDAAHPLHLLNQGSDTLDAFQRRLTACLGAPTDPDEVSEYRRVSNVLSRYGF